MEGHHLLHAEPAVWHLSAALVRKSHFAVIELRKKTGRNMGMADFPLSVSQPDGSGVVVF